MVLLYGRAGRLNTKKGDFRPGKFTSCLSGEEPWRASLVEGVLADFEAEVLPAAPGFRSGVLQGDFNDANIILQGGAVNAVIDFGDAVYSWRVNDVAIAMAYVMVCLCNPANKRGGFGAGSSDALQVG